MNTLFKVEKKSLSAFLTGCPVITKVHTRRSKIQTINCDRIERLVAIIPQITNRATENAARALSFGEAPVKARF